MRICSQCCCQDLFLGLETKTETWTNELECTEFQDHGLEITTLHVVDTVY